MHEAARWLRCELPRPVNPLARRLQLFDPRLFAGAVLGWSSLPGTIVGQVLLQPPPPAGSQALR
jgi:hypothetical protein